MHHGSLFQESWARVNRAQVHRDAFVDNWNVLVDRDSCELVVQRKADRTGEIKFRRTRSVTFDATLELGEMFYQLRAALDCLAFAGVNFGAGDPITNENPIYFPITASPKEYKDRIGQLSALPCDLKNWIATIQPYVSCDGDDETIKLVRRLLKLLHQCAKKDRHRRLTVLTPVTSKLDGNFRFTPHVELVYIRGKSCSIIENEGVIAEFLLSEDVPSLHFNLNANLTFDILMENILFREQEFSQTLTRLIEVVVVAINRFEEAFGVHPKNVTE